MISRRFPPFLQVIVVAFLLLTIMSWWQESPPVPKVESQATRDLSTQKSSDERFESLLATAMKEPMKTDWNAVRHAYARTISYQPYNTGWKEAAPGVAKDIENGNLKIAETSLIKLLEEERYMRIDAHAMAVGLYEKMGGKEKAQWHRECLQGLADSVFVNERGMSFEKPIDVLFIDEEYFVLRFLGIAYKSQSHREKDGHLFDVFTFEGERGQPDRVIYDREIYFNIDMPVHWLKRIFGGTGDPSRKTGTKKQP